MGNFLVDLGRGSYDVQQSNLLSDQDALAKQKLQYGQMDIQALQEDQHRRKQFYDWLQSHPELMNDPRFMMALYGGDQGIRAYLTASFQGDKKSALAIQQANQLRLIGDGKPEPLKTQYYNLARGIENGLPYNPTTFANYGLPSGYVDPTELAGKQAEATSKLPPPFLGGPSSSASPPPSGGGGSGGGLGPYANMSPDNKLQLARALTADLMASGESPAEIAHSLSEAGLPNVTSSLGGAGGIPLSTVREGAPDSPPGVSASATPAPTVVPDNAAPATAPTSGAAMPTSAQSIGFPQYRDWLAQHPEWQPNGAPGQPTSDKALAQYAKDSNNFLERYQRDQQAMVSAKERAIKPTDSQMKFLDNMAATIRSSKAFIEAANNDEIRDAGRIDTFKAATEVANNGGTQPWQDFYALESQWWGDASKVRSPSQVSGNVSYLNFTGFPPINDIRSWRPTPPAMAADTARLLFLDPRYSSARKEYKIILENWKKRGGDISIYEDTLKALDDKGISGRIDTRPGDAIRDKYKNIHVH